MKQKFFELAAKLAKDADHHSYLYGCVIVDKNQIVAKGVNRIKTHPRSGHRFNMTHAELNALFLSKFKDLSGCTAYVYRETHEGKVGMARPCEVCTAALKEAGIRKVYYTTESGFKMEKY